MPALWPVVGASQAKTDRRLDAAEPLALGLVAPFGTGLLGVHPKYMIWKLVDSMVARKSAVKRVSMRAKWSR
jgi:hypothetical protein